LIASFETIDFIWIISSSPRWRRLARRQRTNADDLTRLDSRERSKALWNDRKEVLNPVRPRPNDQNGNSVCVQILLVGQVLVESQQDIEQRIGQ
jgi:hypothetical protein